MLKSLRSSGSNVFVWIIILLLIVGLAGFGIGQSGGGGSNTAVASVGDEDITVDEYVRGLNQEIRQISAQFGQQLTVEQMAALGLDQQLVGQLLVGAALDNEANRLGISAGDETVRDRLMATGAFRDAGGNFSQVTYDFALQNANLTAAQYEDSLREETTRQLFRAVVAGGVQIPDDAARAVVNYLSERRAVDWFRLTDANLSEPIAEPDDEALMEFYTDNEDRYMIPETRIITYAAATEDSVLATIDVNDDEIAALYDERAETYQSPARRLVDRIIFGTDAEADAALTSIRDGERGFDEIATDRGLDASDIDLGEVTEDSLNAAQRTMLFGSDTLGVVGPVATDFGPAIYRVNAVLDASTTTLEEASAELRDEIARDKAIDAISAASEDVVDLVASGAPLEEVASATIMEIGTVTMPDETPGAITDDANFREEALTAEVGEERDVIDLTNGIAIVRVDEIREPTLRPFEEAKADVTADWIETQTLVALSQLGESIVARLDGGEAIETVATELGLIVSQEEPLQRSDIIEDTPPTFVSGMFETELGKSVSIVDGQTMLIGHLNEIVAADPASEEVTAPLSAIQAEMTAATAQDILSLFIGALQDEAGVRVNHAYIANIQTQMMANGNAY
jgi:peptidyl-prolyl cis-trans isomerase D